MEYNFSKLWSNQFFGFYNFKDFIEFASNREVQISYYKHSKSVKIDETVTELDEMPQPLIDAHIKSNDSALDLIKNQFIVFLFTRYEFIIQDTMKCLLCDDSERLLKFLKVYPDYEDLIGFSLKNFIKCESKEAYLAKISEQLSSRIISGKPSNVIKRLKCLLNFDNIDTTLLDELMIMRNSIVHEGQMYQIELEQLEIYYDTIDNLLKVLALALKNISIAVVDSGQLL